MPGLRDTAQQWLAGSRAAVLVEVVEARGSVPREAGTRMLVGEHRVEGTIGGGHLEWKAIASARRMLAGATTTTGAAAATGATRPSQSARLTEHFPLGPALGQCCGGTVTLGYSMLGAAVLAQWPPAAPRFDLQLYGAGHVGRAIVRALAPFNVRITWIDEREDEFNAARLDSPGAGAAEVHMVCVDAVEAEVDLAPPGTLFLVLTHQHDLDLRITEAILRRGDFGFLGLIGSKTKKQRFLHRFEQRGISPQAVERLTCPIGVPGITGKEPEVLAAAVVVQLLQVSSRRVASEGLVLQA
jgi:xanthine dehydrogenase accessory factor